MTHFRKYGASQNLKSFCDFGNEASLRLIKPKRWANFFSGSKKLFPKGNAELLKPYPPSAQLFEFLKIELFFEIPKQVMK